MSHYVGLDVSVKSVSICVVNTQGTVLARGETASDPERIASFTHKHAPDPERVVHESGILAIWLTRELEKARIADHLHRRTPCAQGLVGADQQVRSRRRGRFGASRAYRLVHTGSHSKRGLRAGSCVDRNPGTPHSLRKDLEGLVCGILKPFGVCMGAVHRTRLRRSFRDQLAEAATSAPPAPCDPSPLRAA